MAHLSTCSKKLHLLFHTHTQHTLLSRFPPLTVVGLGWAKNHPLWQQHNTAKVNKPGPGIYRKREKERDRETKRVTERKRERERDNKEKPFVLQCIPPLGHYTTYKLNLAIKIVN